MTMVSRAVLGVGALFVLVLPYGCDRASSGPTASVRARPVAKPVPARPQNFPLSASDYPWPKLAQAYEPIAGRFEPPAGFSRVEVTAGSFAQWLRHIPLRPVGTPVRARNGVVLVPGDAPNLGAVIDIDVRTNQQCADTITRLRAEYLLQANRDDEIVFRAGGGTKLSWPEWKQGSRPHLVGDELQCSRDAEPDGSRKSFEAYLDAVFCWCGTHNLAEEGDRAEGPPAIGDFLVTGGSPGHAVIVVDLAKDTTGQLRALLAQGYMPDQSAHVLAVGPGDPWFRLTVGQPVDIPSWGVFQWTDLRRFG